MKSTTVLRCLCTVVLALILAWLPAMTPPAQAQISVAARFGFPGHGRRPFYRPFYRWGFYGRPFWRPWHRPFYRWGFYARPFWRPWYRPIFYPGPFWRPLPGPAVYAPLPPPPVHIYRPALVYRRPVVVHHYIHHISHCCRCCCCR
jgi:hypothetical protein